MRPWRNRQTRTFEGRVGDRTGSSPVGRTIKTTELFDIRRFLLCKNSVFLCVYTVVKSC